MGGVGRCHEGGSESRQVFLSCDGQRRMWRVSGVVVCLACGVVICGRGTGSCQSHMSVDVGVCGMSSCQGFESGIGCRVGCSVAGVGLIGVGGVV